MVSIRLITRADDAGSSHSANLAMKKVLEAGFIKNISLMAPGPFIEEAVEMLSVKKDVCFGLHGTLNAEWDKMKWRPLGARANGLTDENGDFLPDPSLFEQSGLTPETAIAEYSAQLDKLTRLGFNVRYVDSHMMPEFFIPGFDEAVAEFAKKKGLLDHMYYYQMPPHIDNLFDDFEGFLKTLSHGQFFFLSHPALFSEEMLRTGNAIVSGANVAKSRNTEMEVLSKEDICEIIASFGIKTIRYDEATPFERRLTSSQMAAML